MSNVVDYKQIASSNRNHKMLSDFDDVLTNQERSTSEGLADDIQQYVVDTHKDLINEIRSGKKNKKILESIIDEFIARSDKAYDIPTDFIEQIVNEMVGWERLQPLIDDDEITNIFVNEELKVVKRVRGEDKETNICFDSDEELEQFIKNIAIRTGEPINRDKCVIDGFDNVNNIRINAGIYGSPVRKGEVVRKPYFAIRKYPASNFTEKDFIENETLNEEILDFFKEVVEDSTIVIVGEPDAGKTTLLDLLQSLKNKMRRTIRIEEDPELNFYSKNSVSFVARKTSGEDTRMKYDMAEFAKIAARLAGKDVVVGEVRDQVAWYIYRLSDMGYKLIYTVHGGSCEGGLEQTEFLMSLENHNLSYTQLMKKICKTVDFVIYVSNRKVIDIAEVKGYNATEEKADLNYVFELQVNEKGDLYWEKGEVSPEFKERLVIRKKLKERRV